MQSSEFMISSEKGYSVTMKSYSSLRLKGVGANSMITLSFMNQFQMLPLDSLNVERKAKLGARETIEII